MKEGVAELIHRRRRQIIVNSVIYYRFNSSLISDSVFDKWSRELHELQLEYERESKEAPFYDEFKDFDGSSGFQLPLHDPYWISTAYKILYISSKK